MGVFSFLSGRAWAGIGIAAVVSILAWRGYSAIYDRGFAACEGRHSVELAASIERVSSQAYQLALQDAEILNSGDVTRERIRTIYRDRERELAKMVPINCDACRISDAGIRLLNDALRNAPPAASGANPNPLPGPGLPDTSGRNFRSLDGFTGRDQQVL